MVLCYLVAVRYSTYTLRCGMKLVEGDNRLILHET